MQEIINEKATYLVINSNFIKAEIIDSRCLKIVNKNGCTDSKIDNNFPVVNNAVRGVYQSLDENFDSKPDNKRTIKILEIDYCILKHLEYRKYFDKIFFRWC